MSQPTATNQHKAVAPSSPRRRRWTPPGRGGVFALLLLACLLFGVALSAWLHGRGHRTTETSASHANPEQNWNTLRLTGKTEAVQAYAILAPSIAGEKLASLTITKLAPSGSHVNKGDLLAEFDREAQLRNFLDKQAESSNQTDKLLEAEAKEVADRAKDETEIEGAESRLSKARLEMQKLELMSRIDVERAREELDESQATLAQLQQTFALKRKAAQASIRILQIQRDRTRETMQHAQANAALMQIRSSLRGIVVYNTIWKQGTMGEVKEGDQVSPGTPFMQVVDPSTMEVQAPVNQEDLLKLSVGQNAVVHLDAYPDLTFKSKLRSIDPIGQHGDFSPQLRKYNAIFSIDGADTRLMPDLSTAVELKASGGL